MASLRNLAVAFHRREQRQTKKPRSMASLQRDLAARNHLALRRITNPWPNMPANATYPGA